MNTPDANMSLPRHGGNLDFAVQHFGGDKENWVDLSTGISPWVYPIPKLDSQLWRELPKPSKQLEQCAAHYYHTQSERICVSPGSQLAIRILPTLLDKQTVAIPFIGYQEHLYAWSNAGHNIVFYHNGDELHQLVTSGQVNSAVVINPNNPSNELMKANFLIQIAQQLSDVLIVDEAFADLDNSQSVSDNLEFDNIIVIRSIGKFFGLAGARIGFLIGSHVIILNLKKLFSPWSINSPADYVAQIALSDDQWQQQQSTRIMQQSSEFESILQAFIKTHDLGLECRSNGLFTSLFGAQLIINQLHQYLAKNQLWTRIGDPFTLNQTEQQNWLRLSLPGAHFERLINTLNAFRLTTS